MADKLCIYCKKEHSRRSQWCSDECRIKYRSRLDIRRKKYDESKELIRLVNQMYSISRRLADLLIPKPVDYYENPGKYELHHSQYLGVIDPLTMFWEERKTHHEDHSKMPDINFVDYFTILRLRPDLFEDYYKQYREKMESGEHIESLSNLPCTQIMKRFKVKR